MALSKIEASSIDGLGYGFKNRIINGDMRIDQRNAGASVTPTNGVYTLDRWKVRYSANTCTVQRSTTSPVGFNNSLQLTVGTARTVVSGDRFGIEQPIEGFNSADFGWGTANAQSVTLSFWVRSSLTGTFGLCFSNFSRGYAATYTISAANTWEYKTVTIAGDTSGTWDSTSSAGVIVMFDIGMGSDVRTTTGSWQAGTFLGATGATNLVSTSGATFYITGVQLEKGTVATSFDYRSIGTEFSLCQRYFQTNIPYGTAPANGLSTYISTVMNAYSTGGGYGSWITFPTVMRATPTTFTFYKPSASVGADGQWVYYTGTWVSFTTTGTAQAAPTGFAIEAVKGSAFTSNLAYIMLGSYTASAEL